MKLVSDWRKAWKWHSTQIAALLAIVPVVWMNLPSDVKAMIPEAWTPYIITVFAVGAIIGRLRDQGDA